MLEKSGPSEAGRLYAEAYEIQYTKNDLHSAFELYKNLNAVHPNTKEAEYSRSQIINIVNAVVSKEKLFESYLNLISTHFGGKDQKDVKPAPVKPPSLALNR